MKTTHLLLLLALCANSQSKQLIPEYQTNKFYTMPYQQIILFIRPAGTMNYMINYTKEFTSIPQIIICWTHVDIDGGPISYSTRASSITKDSFTFTVFSTNTIVSIKINWLAFLDDNIHAQNGVIQQNIQSQTMYFDIPLTNPQNDVPQAAVFLNGITQTQTLTSNDYNYLIGINAVYSNSILLQIQVKSGYAISQLHYNIIYGSHQYLSTGQSILHTFGQIQMFTVDSRTKVSLVGVSYLFGFTQVRIDIINNQGSVNVYSWAPTILTQTTLSYFKYMPCPQYCTTCYNICDSCVPTTYRTGSDCTSCQTNRFLTIGQLNCEQCMSYCDGCQGSATNCISCLTSTQRIGLPYCMTCPSQMFIQSGVDNCQCKFQCILECANYCNECSSYANSCISCQINSQRSNPPDCLTCPAQYYVVYNILSCQQCPTYCNNCQNYTALCIACSSTSLRLNPPYCMDCPQNTYINGNTCTQCDQSCQSCNSDKCLTCLSSQYINTLGKCISCPQHCLTCDINNCYTCVGNCQQCNLIGCIQCISDNYYIQGSDCYQCPENCLTCNSVQCLTCIGPRIPINNECECQSPCLTCDSYQCLTCITSDYRIQDKACQYCPLHCVACDNLGNCYTEPQNCQLAIITNNQQIECTKCQSNYYLQNNTCIQEFDSCSPQCLECLNQPQNCTVCRFQDVSQTECQLCESQNGLYSNYDSNTCYTICGDGILSGKEQCDDGNQYNLDGCSNCQIDSGYYCNGVICDIIVYPVPSIYQNIVNDTVYNRYKQFYISYNVPIMPTNLDLQIDITNFTRFSYNISQFNSQLFDIKITLKDQLIDQKIHVVYKNKSLIVSNSGFQQQISMVSVQISDYILLTTSDQQISEATNNLMLYLLYLIGIIICTSVLFGGLELYFNLLDLLQTISYLKYINTVKPQYLQTFFNLFGFIQLQNLPLNSIFNIQSYIQDYIDPDDFNQTPALIHDDGYTTSSTINIVTIVNLFILSIVVFLLAEILIYLNNKIECIFNFRWLKHHLKIMKFIYQFRRYTAKSCNNIVNQWIWSGFIRIFISSAYDISFFICLGIYGLQFNLSNLIITADLALTIFLFIMYLLITFLISLVAGYDVRTQIKYAALYEGLTQNSQITKQHITYMFMKKMLFMVFLVLLYNEPLFQILNIIFIQICHLIYLIIIDPIHHHKDKIKQIICELFMLVAEIQLAILVIHDYEPLFVYENRRIFGWICILALVIIILTQLIIDSWEQISYYYKKYPQFQKTFNNQAQ